MISENPVKVSSDCPQSRIVSVEGDESLRTARDNADLKVLSLISEGLTDLVSLFVAQARKIAVRIN